MLVVDLRDEPELPDETESGLFARRDASSDLGNDLLRPCILNGFRTVMGDFGGTSSTSIL